MLYLIKDRDYLKIGFTTDLKSRLISYNTTNCYCTLLDSKPGSKMDETNLHDLCKPWTYKLEWFTNTPEVINIWNNYESIFPEFIDIKNNIEQVIDILKTKKLDFKKCDKLLDLGTYNNMKMLKCVAEESNNEEYVNVLSTWKNLHNIFRFLEYHDHTPNIYYFSDFKIETLYIDNKPTINIF